MNAGVLFPGQGSQTADMAEPWTVHEAGRAVLDLASEAIGRDLVEACRDEGLLATTEFVQPALLACDVAAFRVLEAEGVAFAAAAGHSLGEFAALVAAGALELADALEVVRVRGRAMQRASEERPGTMSALIGLGPEEAAAICAGQAQGEVLVVANENAPNQVVVSGTPGAVERAELAARARGARAIRLAVAGAFHSALMEPALEPIRAALDAVEIRTARIPVVANVTGEPVRDAAQIRALLERHVVSPVRWEQSMRWFADSGFDALVEAGPGQVLAKLAGRQLPGIRALPAGSPPQAAEVARLLAGQGRREARA
ncbi:MAG TPA: ACP S-malonyltransferase [Actinomycetota bacterium]|nr:ACP S-malonyltransferase [Actinomycetota bacterium]